MARSTHSDRSTAWAAKQKNPGYKIKKNIPNAADLINQRANNPSSRKAKEVFSEIETIKEED